jgi:hypothetical protein
MSETRKGSRDCFLIYFSWVREEFSSQMPEAVGAVFVRLVLAKLLTRSSWLAFQSIKAYLMGPM